MDDIFETVNRNNLAFPTFVLASCDEDFVVFADRDGADLWGDWVG